MAFLMHKAMPGARSMGRFLGVFTRDSKAVDLRVPEEPALFTTTPYGLDRSFLFFYQHRNKTEENYILACH